MPDDDDPRMEAFDRATAEAAPQPVTCDPPGAPYQNAKQFRRANYDHPEHPVLVHQGGEWYRWTGTCWPTFDHGQLRAELYEYFERAVYLDDDKGLTPFNPSRRKIDDLIDALRAVAYIPIETPVPSWLEKVSSAPAADEIVACANGLVHVPTRTLYPHTPTFYAHHAVPFKFVPNAPSPERWHAFLHDLWGDDVETIATLQEVFGYLVSGETRLQKMFLVIGPKRSGKGTIARVLTAMLGHHHVAGPTLAGMGTNFGLSPVIGKPVAIISDARLSSSDNTSIVTERLLSISGDDTLTIDRKYREPWTGQLTARIVILSNELPRLTDSSGALASRFITLIMTRSFYGRENPTLTTELCAELPGIFNWALDGLGRLRDRGRFQQPAASQDAIREMEDLGSPIGAFVRDRCEVGPVHEVPCDDLYQAWRQWCQDHGRDRPGTTQTFGRDLRAVLPGIKVTQPRIGADERIRKYAGIALGCGENDGEARVPPRANSWSSGAADDLPRDRGSSRATPEVAETLEKQDMNGDLERDGTRTKPMYSYGAPSERLGSCDYCHDAVYRGQGKMAEGRLYHDRCVGLLRWSGTA